MSASFVVLLEEYKRAIQNVIEFIQTIDIPGRNALMIKDVLVKEIEMWKEITEGSAIEPDQLLRSLWRQSQIDKSGVPKNVWQNQDIAEQLEDVRRLHALVLFNFYDRASDPDFGKFARYVDTGMRFARNVLGILGGLEETRDQTIGKVAGQLNAALRAELGKNIRLYFDGEPLQRNADVGRALDALAVELEQDGLRSDLAKLFRGYRSTWQALRNQVIDTDSADVDQVFVDDFAKVFDLIAEARDAAAAVASKDPTAAEAAQVFINRLNIVQQEFANVFDEGLPSTPSLIGLLTAETQLLNDADFKEAFVELSKAMTMLKADLEHLASKPFAIQTETYIKQLRRLVSAMVQTATTAETTEWSLNELENAAQEEAQQFIDLLWIPGTDITDDTKLRASFKLFPRLIQEFSDRIENLLELRRTVLALIEIEQSGVSAGPSSRTLPSIEASWRQTEDDILALASRVNALGTDLSKSDDAEALAVHAAAAALGKAHKAVMEHRAATEKGQESDSMSAEHLLYQAVNALRESALTQDHKDELKTLIAASPRQSTLVKVEIVIKSQESLDARDTRNLFRKVISGVIVCPTTTFREVIESETTEDVNKALTRFGRTLASSVAIYKERRRLRKDKRFVSRVKLEDVVINTKFQRTDSSGKIERRDFPLGRKYRDDVTLAYVFKAA